MKTNYIFFIVLIIIAFALALSFHIPRTTAIEPQDYSILRESEQIKIYGEIITPIESLCSTIKGTPAWGKDGKIFDYGYKEELNELPDGVFFYYHDGCSWCEKQIENFGDNWEEIKQNGYAINCE